MKKENGKHTNTQNGKRVGLLSYHRTMQLFTEIKKAYSMLAAKQITEKAREQSSRYWSSLDEMPLYSFAKCLCDKDYSYLYKKGVPNKRIEHNEKEYFTEFVESYNELISGKSNNYEDISKYNKYISMIRILESSFIFVQNTPENIKNILKKTGIRIQGNTERDLAVIQGKIDYYIREIKNLQEKFEKQSKGDDVKLIHFQSMLISLSTYFKIYLSIYEITVSEYCTYFLQYRKEVEIIKRQRNGIRNHT